MGRWGSGVRCLAVLLVLASSGCSVAAELRALRTAPIDNGANLTLDLSEAVDVQVTDVSEADGTVRRIYVDLPANTVVAPGARRLDAPVAPIASARIGQADNGAVRLAIDAGGASKYRVERVAGGRTLVLTLSAPLRVATPPSRPRGVVAGPLPPARRTTAARAPLPKLAAEKPLKIVLDPGHGGRDPGAAGYAVEKEVTLAIAQRLAVLLRARLDADVVLTRTDDATLELRDRTARANAEGADLFVSIHLNSSPNGDLRGVETYYLNNTNDRATIRLASLENGLDLLHPGQGQQTDLRYILSDMIQVGKIDQSVQLARAVQRSLVRSVRTAARDAKDLGVKKGPFYVLVGAYMPCVLVEVAFLNHPVEGPRVATADYQERIAQGLYDGIAQFTAPSRRRRTL